MNKKTRGRPILFILCLLFGVVLFLIHNLMMPFSVDNSTASDEDVSYPQQAQTQQSESGKEQLLAGHDYDRHLSEDRRLLPIYSGGKRLD